MRIPAALGSKTSRKPSIETFKYIIKFAERNTSGQMIIFISSRNCIIRSAEAIPMIISN